MSNYLKAIWGSVSVLDDNSSCHAKSISEIPSKCSPKPPCWLPKNCSTSRGNAPGFYVHGRARAEWETQSHFRSLSPQSAQIKFTEDRSKHVWLVRRCVVCRALLEAQNKVRSVNPTVSKARAMLDFAEGSQSSQHQINVLIRLRGRWLRIAESMDLHLAKLSRLQRNGLRSVDTYCDFVHTLAIPTPWYLENIAVFRIKRSFLKANLAVLFHDWLCNYTYINLTQAQTLIVICSFRWLSHNDQSSGGPKPPAWSKSDFDSKASSENVSHGCRRA